MKWVVPIVATVGGALVALLTLAWCLRQRRNLKSRIRNLQRNARDVCQFNSAADTRTAEGNFDADFDADFDALKSASKSSKAASKSVGGAPPEPVTYSTAQLLDDVEITKEEVCVNYSVQDSPPTVNYISTEVAYASELSAYACAESDAYTSAYPRELSAGTSTFVSTSAEVTRGCELPICAARELSARSSTDGVTEATRANTIVSAEDSAKESRPARDGELSQPNLMHHEIPIPTLACRVPEPPKAVGEWTQMKALMFPAEAKPDVSGLFAAAPARYAVAEGALVSIEVRSDDADVQPPIKCGIMWLANGAGIEETFHVRLRKSSALIRVDFTVAETAVGIGSVSLGVEVAAPRNSMQVKSPLQRGHDRIPRGVYFVHSPVDAGVARELAASLELFGLEPAQSIGAAATVQVLWSENCAGEAGRLRAEIAANLERVRVTYWDPQSLRALPELLQNSPIAYYRNTLPELLAKLEETAGQMKDETARRAEDTRAVQALLQQCVGMLEANFRAICEAAGDACPKLFHVWPLRATGARRLLPSNWAMHKYKLHLLCEGADAYKKGNGPHYVFDLHPGYEVSSPREWFARWGPVIVVATRLLCAAGKVAGTALGAGALSSLIPAGLPLEHLRRAEVGAGAAISGYTGDDSSLRDRIIERARTAIDDMERAVEFAPQIPTENCDKIPSQKSQSAAAFAALGEFLKNRSPPPQNAGLALRFHKVGTPDAGRATWVCPTHAAVIDKFGVADCQVRCNSMNRIAHRTPPRRKCQWV